MPNPRTAKTIVTVAIVLVFILLLGIAGGMDKADAAAGPQPEHHCYAVTDALGAQPVEVPCESAPAPSPETVTPGPPPSLEVVMPAASVPTFVRAQTIRGPRRSRRIHRSFPHR